MAQTTTTESTNGNGKREAKALTAAEAISKISKIFDQLSATDIKRVLAFFNVSSETTSE